MSVAASALSIFQSTLPSRERLYLLLEVLNLQRFQSTLPSRERPASSDSRCNSIKISIHAPKPGATNVTAPYVYIRDISIHAPKPGATIKGITGDNVIIDFNPRSQAGSDHHYGT